MSEIKLKWNQYAKRTQDNFGPGFKAYYVYKYKGLDLVKAFFRALPSLKIRFRSPVYFIDANAEIE